MFQGLKHIYGVLLIKLWSLNMYENNFNQFLLDISYLMRFRDQMNMKFFPCSDLKLSSLDSSISTIQLKYFSHILCGRVSQKFHTFCLLWINEVKKVTEKISKAELHKLHYFSKTTNYWLIIRSDNFQHRSQ